jgi:hypothetical protein
MGAARGALQNVQQYYVRTRWKVPYSLELFHERGVFSPNVNLASCVRGYSRFYLNQP